MDNTVNRASDFQWGHFLYRTVDLLEILTFNLSAFYAMGMLEGGIQRGKNYSVDEEQWSKKRASLRPTLEAVYETLKAADMPLAVRQMQDILGVLDTVSGAEFFRLTQDLHSRVAHYFEIRTALVIPSDQRRFFDEPLGGWGDAIEQFPLAIDHIEEASKCLALGRNTACVYHLTAPIQEVLESLAKRLGCTLDPTSDTWNKLLSDIDVAMVAKSKSMPKPKWKAEEAFFAEIVSDVKAIKNAWRNPTMHFRRTYTDAQARKIYERVQEFMAHASIRLRGRRS